MTNQGTADLATIEFILNSAQWEVGIALAPTLEGCEAQATDGDTTDSEVR